MAPLVTRSAVYYVARSVTSRMCSCRSFIGKVKHFFLLNNYHACFFRSNGQRLFSVQKRAFFNPNIRSLGFVRMETPKQLRFFMYGGILTALGITKEEKEDPLIHTIKLGIYSLQKEDYDTAEQILHAALKMAQERVDTQAVTYIYDILANVAFQKGDFKKAEMLFVDVMNRMMATGTAKEDNAIVEMSLKLASMFDQQNEFDKAKEGYQFCIKTQQEKVDKIDLSLAQELTEVEQDTLILWAMARDWYGRHLLLTGKLKDAQDSFVQAYNMSEKVNGPLHHQTLVLMNDIGSIATLREEYDEAIGFLEKAIEKGKIGNTPDLPAFYCNLGATYMKKGDNTQALTFCKEAFRLAKTNQQKEAEQDALGCLQELRKLGFK